MAISSAADPDDTAGAPAQPASAIPEALPNSLMKFLRSSVIIASPYFTLA